MTHTYTQLHTHTHGYAHMHTHVHIHTQHTHNDTLAQTHKIYQHTSIYIAMQIWVHAYCALISVIFYRMVGFYNV